jgi:hypothetical protein
MSQRITLSDFGVRCEFRQGGCRESLLDGENTATTHNSTVETVIRL